MNRDDLNHAIKETERFITSGRRGVGTPERTRSMIEQIARQLCEADGYDPDIIGLSDNPRWWLYTRTAEHTIPLLAEAWSLGVGVGMFCGPYDIPPNPYRKEDQ